MQNPKIKKINCKERGGVLLYGPEGLYQKQDALFLAGKALDTEDPEKHPDFISVEAVDGVLGVASIEQLVQKLSVLTACAIRFVVFIDHLEQMNITAQNKLLKVLEEWDAYFICIYYGENVLPTIKSRLSVVPYRPYCYEEYHRLTGKDLESYCITGGCPQLLGDDELCNIFRKIKECLKKGLLKDIYSELGLVLEKDEHSFFVCYRDKVSALFSYMGRVYADMGFSYDFVKEVADCSIASADVSRYTHADFFCDMARVLEGGNDVI